MKFINTLFYLLLFTTIGFCQNSHIELEGAIILSDVSTATPTTGMIRWNNSSRDFEGYNGIEWLSLTMSSPIDSKYDQTTIENTQQNTSDQRLGTSVAMYDDWAFIGAPKASRTIYQGTTGYDNRGVVDIYKFDGYTWHLHSQLELEEIDQKDGFGASIAVHENRLAISSVMTDIQGLPISNSSNAVYVYELVQGQWINQYEILDPDGVQQDGFGLDLDIFGDFLVVGTPYRDIGNNTDAGCAYVFEKDDTNNFWSLYGDRLESNSPNQDDHFGWAVAIENELIVTGTPGKDFGANVNQGEINSFKNTTSNEFIYVETLTLANGGVADNLGHSIDISEDILVVGAAARKVKNSPFAGAVAYFKLGSSGTWDFESEIINPNYSSVDFFGWDVNLYGNELLVGVLNRDLSNTTDNFGSAIRFQLRQGQWNFKEEYYDKDPFSNAHAGASVALGKYHALIGAPRHYATDEYRRPGKAFIQKHKIR